MRDEILTEIPDELLDRLIEGVGLSGETLRDELGRDPVILAFLRHFG